MIRTYVLVGLFGGLAVVYLTVFQLGPVSQLPPSESLLVGFREDGFVPQSVDLYEDDAVEHEIFGVPPEDEAELAKAKVAMGDMSGMDMSGGEENTMTMPDGSVMKVPTEPTMEMADGSEMAEGSTMKMDEGATTEMAEGSTMKMDEGATTEMDEGATTEMVEGSTMKMDEGATTEMAEGSTMKMDEGATTEMAKGDMAMKAEEDDAPHDEEENEEAPHGEGEAGGSPAGGLLITAEGDFDREIDLKMSEWRFSEMNIEVKKGERIRFNVTNDGEILHEFMVMQMVQMQAVAYRVERADWSLLEHEALFEKSLMLPTQTISFVLEVQENGSWMFMCMLPFHMQMGMMGQMATPGMAMDMEM